MRELRDWGSVGAFDRRMINLWGANQLPILSMMVMLMIDLPMVMCRSMHRLADNDANSWR